jgi:hypothetical protein
MTLKIVYNETVIMLMSPRTENLSKISFFLTSAPMPMKNRMMCAAMLGKKYRPGAPR